MYLVLRRYPVFEKTLSCLFLVSSLGSLGILHVIISLWKVISYETLYLFNLQYLLQEMFIIKNKGNSHVTQFINNVDSFTYISYTNK